MGRLATRLGGLVPFVVTALAAAASIALEAQASDFAHECRSSDGTYAISGGGLARVVGPAGQQSGAIDYRIVRETIIQRTSGYCVSKRDGARFGYDAVQSVQQIAFRDGGRNVTAFMICEIASSGLPAARSCDRDVQTMRFRADLHSQPHRFEADQAAREGWKASRWRRGGSDMILYAKADQRRLVFASVGPEDAARGASPGDVAFTGRREGNAYLGLSFDFSPGCGARAYRAEGRVGSNQTTVTFNGEVEAVAGDCTLQDVTQRTIQIVFVSR